jgi:hypothetical protein
MLSLAFFLTGALMAQEAKVTPLTSKDLPEFPGKKALMISVEYPRAVPILSITTMRTPSSTCWRALS